MKVVISQPRYLPVISYIHRLYFAEKFVILDNVQRQSRGWENRNQLLINGTPKWLTIPVNSSTREIIYKTKISNDEWIIDHINAIGLSYKNSPFFDYNILIKYYLGLSEILNNQEYNYSLTICKTLMNLCEIFDFKPNIILASEINDQRVIEEQGVNKLLAICKALNASSYISGANGKEYGVIECFNNSGIELKIHHTESIEYKQNNSQTFVPHMAFFDMLFNMGKERTMELIKSKPILIE
jgi:hypothetical protein